MSEHLHTPETNSEEDQYSIQNKNDVEADVFTRDGQIEYTNTEQLMARNEALMASRFQVKKSVRREFLRACRERMDALGEYDKLALEELIKLRDEYETKDQRVYEVLVLAVNKCEETDEQFFYFRDFNRYCLTLKPDLFSNYPLVIPMLGVLAYYFFSAFLFCYVMGNNSVCPKDEGHWHEGWLTAVYFASVTMSTVGYGDVSLIGSGNEHWRVFIGILFMLVSVIIAVTLVSALGNMAASEIKLSRDVTPPFLRKLGIEIDKDKSIHYRIRWTRIFRLLELAFLFSSLNLFGMVVARITFALGKDDVDWSWLTTFYWAIQTTTTIGYGDLTMPSDLKWFNIFFAAIGTGFAAKVLSALSNLNGDLADMRRFYDWHQMEISHGLIESMESTGDGKIDEYEFLVASLIALDKIKKEDITEIMDKFRKVAGCGDDHAHITKEDIIMCNKEYYQSIRAHDKYLHLL